MGRAALRIRKIDDGAYLRMDYSDGHQFWLDRAGRRVWGIWPEGSSLAEATSYLLGPVMGVLLRHRGVICLHASAVAINGRAVAFVGPPGAGKSTMAAALANEAAGSWRTTSQPSRSGRGCFMCIRGTRECVCGRVRSGFCMEKTGLWGR